MVEDCPKCGGHSVESTPHLKFCLYLDCDFMEDIPSLEDRVIKLEKSVAELKCLIQ